MITRRSMFARIGAALATLSLIGRKSKAFTDERYWVEFTPAPQPKPSPFFIAIITKKTDQIAKIYKCHRYEVRNMDRKLLGDLFTSHDFGDCENCMLACWVDGRIALSASGKIILSDFLPA